MDTINTREVAQGSYLSKHGYVIKKSFLTDSALSALKSALVARPLCDDKYGRKDDGTYPVYIETSNKLYIPRQYGISTFGPPKKELASYLGKPVERTLPFSGTLRDSQMAPYEALIRACEKKGGGVLQLGTGTGKTFLGIKAISDLGKRALVIVNKIPLMKQWETEIQRYLPSASVGVLQGQKHVDVHGKDIVIGMLQSMSMIDYPDSFFEDIGVVIIDEIHNVSSKVFSKVLFKISSKMMIGLSATPERADGLSYVFSWHIGDVLYRSKTVREGLRPIVKMIRLTSDKYTEHATINRMTGQRQIQFTTMLGDLVDMRDRNNCIADIVVQCAAQQRKILVLSDRRQHLVELKSLLQRRGTPYSFGLFLGNMKIAALEESKRADVILATYKAFGEGVSEKDLDTVVLTTPKKFVGHMKHVLKKEAGSLEQIVGRIFRKRHEDRHPLIVDLQDQFSVYKNQAQQRTVFYRQHFRDNCVLEALDHCIDNNDTCALDLNASLKRTLLVANEEEHGAISQCVL